jgi:hypothetical protein
MTTQRGVLFQTVPEEVAQAVDLLCQRFQLPSEVIVKAAVSMLMAEADRDSIRVERFMDMVRADFQRSLDRVLA